jgi:hypothetical protein
VGARKFQYKDIWGTTKGTNWFPESIYFRGYLDTFTFGVDYGGETGVVETTYDFEPAAAATAPKVVALNNRSLLECDYEPRYVGHRVIGGIGLTGDAMKSTPSATARIAQMLKRKGIIPPLESKSYERGSAAANYYVELEQFERAINALCAELF